MINLAPLIKQLGYSKMALAEEAKIPYNTLNHLIAGRTERPKWSTANALLLVLNRALDAQNQPQFRLEEIEEFSDLRDRPDGDPDHLAKSKTASTPLSHNNLAETETVAKPKAKRNRQKVQPGKGRPKGKRKRPDAVAPLSAADLFLREIFGPKAYSTSSTGKSRGAELLDMVAQELAPLRPSKEPNSATSNDKDRQGFTVIASHLARLHPATIRPGTLTVQLEPLPPVESLDSPVAIASNETTWHSSSSKEQAHLAFRVTQVQEVTPPLVPGGEVVLSLEEFESLTLLQLKLLLDLYFDRKSK